MSGGASIGVAVDVGNSSIKAKCFLIDRDDERPRTDGDAPDGGDDPYDLGAPDDLGAPRVRGDAESVADWIADRRPSVIAVVSVCTPRRDRLRRRIDEIFAAGSFGPSRPRWSDLDAGSFGLRLDVDHPDRLGVDRVAAAAGALGLCGGDAIVLDSGTAITVDLVRADSSGPVFLGGAILPGVGLQSESLARGADALAVVDRLVDDPPRWTFPPLPAKNTADAITAGTLYGCAAAIDAIIRRYRAGHGPIPVVGTGGDVGRLIPIIDAAINYQSDLVCDAIAAITFLNASPPR